MSFKRVSCVLSASLVGISLFTSRVARADGRGVFADQVEANRWFEKARVAGDLYADQTPFDVSPAVGLDQRLFMAYSVEMAYHMFPDSPSAYSVRTWVNNFGQKDFKDMLQRERTEMPNEDSDEMLLDCIQLGDACNAYLRGLDDIAKQKKDREATDTLNDLASAGQTVGAARDEDAPDADGNKPVVMPALKGILDFVVLEHQSEQKHEHEASAATDEQDRQLTDAFQRGLGRAIAANARLAARCGWSAEETPFRMEFVTGDDDMAALAKQQPRNLYPRLIALKSHVPTDSEQALMDDAGQCIAGARLIPAGYDSLRLGLAQFAAKVATRAVMKGGNNRGGFSGSPEQLGMSAARYWQTVKMMRGGKLEPEESWGLAKALACDGRLQEAMTEAQKALDWSNQTSSSDFAYDYVCLSCATGQAMDNCFNNLKAAFARKPQNVRQARTDPDLAVLRSQKADAFNDLVAVKPTYFLQYGLVNDDVTMTNHSAIALTNVSVSFVFHQNDGILRTGQLYAPFVGAGQSCTFSNCISVPGSWVSSWGPGSFTCDQSE